MRAKAIAPSEPGANATVGTKGIREHANPPDMKANTSVKEDEYRRKPSTRAANPISRGLMASAGSHKDFVYKSQTLVGYLFNPRVYTAIAAAALLAPLLAHWLLANTTITVVVILAEASILLTVSWLVWRVWRRDKSAGKSG